MTETGDKGRRWPWALSPAVVLVAVSLLIPTTAAGQGATEPGGQFQLTPGGPVHALPQPRVGQPEFVPYTGPAVFNDDPPPTRTLTVVEPATPMGRRALTPPSPFDCGLQALERFGVHCSSPGQLKFFLALGIAIVVVPLAALIWVLVAWSYARERRHDPWAIPAHEDSVLPDAPTVPEASRAPSTDP